MTTLVEKIENLETEQLNQEEEYQFSSKFLEWFYMNVYRGEAFDKYPVLHSVSKEPEFQMMKQLCYFLINLQHSKHFTEDTRVQLYNDMKRWTVEMIKKHSDNT